MFTPRDYQQAAIEAANRSENGGLIILPTGSGKSVVAANLIPATGDVLMLCPSKELVEQNASKINEPVDCWFSGSKTDPARIVISTFSSAVSRLRNSEKTYKTIIIDEAHRIAASTKIGQLINRLGASKIFGLTATPKRLQSGLIYGPNGFFDEVVYEVSRETLKNKGFLSNRNFVELESSLVGEGVQMKGTDFDLIELSKKVTDESLKCLDRLPGDIDQALIFCVDIAHAQKVAEHVKGEYVTGKTPKKQREDIIRRFKSGQIKYLVSVQTLTTGFDYPALKNLIILRPTASSVLLEQCIGRGDRIHESKEQCNIYDFTDNFYRFIYKYDPFVELKKGQQLTDRDRRIIRDHRQSVKASNARLNKKDNFIRLKTIRRINDEQFILNEDIRMLLSLPCIEEQQKMIKQITPFFGWMFERNLKAKKTIHTKQLKLFVTRDMKGSLNLESSKN